MRIHGIWPMLYAFFNADGTLSMSAFDRQVAAARAAGAPGVAVLGLGTEVHKLGQAERRATVGRVLSAADGLPVAVTIADTTLPDAVDGARAAESAGAAWLVLQPPRPPATGADLADWFATIASAVACPVAIQNAPEFLGLGLNTAEIRQLADRCPNLVAIKAESSAVALGELADALEGRLALLNGRGGLELTDNYRAGATGMIPGIETVDLQISIVGAMEDGREQEAEILYRRLLPFVAFAMQGLDSFVCYGKHVAALRLGLPADHGRAPRLEPTKRGLEWAARHAAEFGPLP